jgi:hypothetical protein
MAIPKTWIQPLGAISDRAEKHFNIVEQGFAAVLKEFEGKISYKEMYHIAGLAASGAVARLVTTHVNKRDFERSRRKRNDKVRTR